MAQDQTAAAVANPNARRKKALLIAAAVLILGAAGYATYWALFARYFVDTDNAYVNGYLVQVMPQAGGTVIAVHAEDTDLVQSGQVLVRLDRADAKVQLEQAEADLARVVRETSTVFVNNSVFEALVVQRRGDVARAEADLLKAQTDLERRRTLVDSGAVSGEELTHAASTLASAQSARAAAVAALRAAQQQLQSNQTLTRQTTVTEHPNVQRASSRVRETYLAYARSEVPAPLSGYVAKRSVHVGQRAQAGTPLMAIVPLDQVWVDANFKEAQLRDVRIGQPVTLTADLYGSRVEYQGRVAGLGAGTGAAFALLPAQNATGNWIKVVQRLPVRIELEPAAVRAHPLRVGLSMRATIDTRSREGAVLAERPREQPVMQTDVYEQQLREAQGRIERIVLANAADAASNTALAAAAAVAARR